MRAPGREAAARSLALRVRARCVTSRRRRATHRDNRVVLSEDAHTRVVAITRPPTGLWKEERVALADRYGGDAIPMSVHDAHIGPTNLRVGAATGCPLRDREEHIPEVTTTCATHPRHGDQLRRNVVSDV